jgi:hypothetical protein
LTQVYEPENMTPTTIIENSGELSNQEIMENAASVSEQIRQDRLRSDIPNRNTMISQNILNLASEAVGISGLVSVEASLAENQAPNGQGTAVKSEQVRTT